jgi:pyrroline-5-carboxylate reductase
MTLGVIGTGHLAGFLVRGLRRAGYGSPIVLSPRNAEHAARLAQDHDCRVAPDNQAVAEAAECLLVTLRPADAPAALSTLRLRPGTLVISTVAGLPHSGLTPLVGKAELVTAMPISAAEYGESPTLLFPDHAGARQLLRHLGEVIAFPDQETYSAATANAGLYGWIFALMAALERENRAQGLPPELARQVVTGTFRAAAGVAQQREEESLSDILTGLATKGGITAQGLQALEEAGALKAWRKALATIAKRLSRGRG